jgi:UDP-galactopyranose mutase
MTKSLVTVKAYEATGKTVPISFSQDSDYFFSMTMAIASDGMTKMA